MSSACRLLAVLAVVVVLGACASLDPLLKPGFRTIVMSVENTSNRPAILVVANVGEMHTIGDVVGTATPGTVPPGVTMDVTFGLPPEPGWGIFVDPVPQSEPLFFARDVPPDASGRAPFTITVDGNGIGVISEGDNLSGWKGIP